MVFKSFRFQVLLRTIGIGLSLMGLSWSIYETDFLMTPIVFSLLTVIQVIGLVYYSESSLKELKRFFDSFSDHDYTRKFEETGKGKAFDELGKTFNRVIDEFRKIRIQREEHYQYLLQVNEHVNVGLICFKEDGSIDLMNSAACELLNKPVLDQIGRLKNADPHLHEALLTLSPGEKMLYKYQHGPRTLDLAIMANKFKLGDTRYTLISLQNIRSELDAQEMQAWRKLIRVLTHEIMNSVTPVVTLTTAIQRMMEEEPGAPRPFEELEEEEEKDIYKSITAIANRGKGLLDFVNAYRDYTKEPEPEKEPVDLVMLVEGILQVLRPTLGDIRVDFEVGDAIMESVDRNLIEQVVINLIKNAAEALEGVSESAIRIEVSPEAKSIVIADNGPGIPEDIRDEIFVPFFTTKPKGNGIGLSLCKQIMKAHGGDILVKSGDEGTAFSLIFAS